MEIPNLPTDNLYKFRALSGLSIIIFFISIFVIRLARIDENINKLKIEIGELEFERVILQEKDSLFALEAKNLGKALEKYKFDPVDTIILLDSLIKDLHNPAHREYLQFIFSYQNEVIPEQKLLNALNQRLKQREENSFSLRSKANSIDIKNEILNSDIKALRRFTWLMSLGIGIGVYFTLSGFRLWYNKVQKYLDKKLENEAQIENEK